MLIAGYYDNPHRMIDLVFLVFPLHNVHHSSFWLVLRRKHWKPFLKAFCAKKNYKTKFYCWTRHNCTHVEYFGQIPKIVQHPCASRSAHYHRTLFSSFFRVLYLAEFLTLLCPIQQAVCAIVDKFSSIFSLLDILCQRYALLHEATKISQP